MRKKYYFQKKKKIELNEEIINLEDNISTLTNKTFYIEEFKFHFNKIVKHFFLFKSILSDFQILFKEVLFIFLNSGYNFCDANIFYPYYYNEYDKDKSTWNFNIHFK